MMAVRGRRQRGGVGEMGEEGQKAKRKGKRPGCKLRVNRLKTVHDCRP